MVTGIGSTAFARERSQSLGESARLATATKKTFEMIYVCQQHHAATALAMRAGNLSRQQIHDDAPIEKTCQRIVCGLEPHIVPRFDKPVFQLQDAQSGS